LSKVILYTIEEGPYNCFQRITYENKAILNQCLIKLKKNNRNEINFFGFNDSGKGMKDVYIGTTRISFDQKKLASKIYKGCEEND